jgi:hypothetical protein
MYGKVFKYKDNNMKVYGARVSRECISAVLVSACCGLCG